MVLGRHSLLSLGERVTRDLMKALEMMKVLVGTEILVQGRKKKKSPQYRPVHHISSPSKVPLQFFEVLV